MEQDNQNAEVTAKNLRGVPFQKGDDPRRNMEGRPKGSLSFATALKLEAEKQAGIITLEDGTTKKVSALELITRKLVELGKNGDMQAIKEIADRMDGKAKQSLDHTTDGEKIMFLPSELINKHGITPSTETNSE